MKMRRNVAQIIFPLLLTVTMFAAGCAKEPATDASMAPPPAPAPEVAAATDPAPAPASTFQDEKVMEQARTDAAAQSAQSIATAQQSAEAQLATLTRINFDYDQYVLSAPARDTLAANATVLKALPTVKVKIEGHCDERGSDQYNIALGERRAQAAMNYLVSLGVNGGQLSTVSFGEEMPLDPGPGEEAWAKNRRAEFKPVK